MSYVPKRDPLSLPPATLEQVADTGYKIGVQGAKNYIVGPLKNQAIDTGKAVLRTAATANSASRGAVNLLTGNIAAEQQAQARERLRPDYLQPARTVGAVLKTGINLSPVATEFGLGAANAAEKVVAPTIKKVAQRVVQQVTPQTEVFLNPGQLTSLNRLAGGLGLKRTESFEAIAKAASEAHTNKMLTRGPNANLTVDELARAVQSEFRSRGVALNKPLSHFHDMIYRVVRK